jgi:preprotein translocase subunit SecA
VGSALSGPGGYHTGRLDDQLRGRAGRQGDPGGSVFFTSLRDELVTRHVPEAEVPTQVDDDGRILDGRAQHTVEHAQRVAEGAHLESQRTTWRYNQLISAQRAVALDHRNLVLHGDMAARRLADQCPERCSALSRTVSEDVLAIAARLIVLYHLDYCWTEHLVFLTDVREGIHLRALARETPLDEFHRIAINTFKEFFKKVYANSVETFLEVNIAAEGIDLEAMGLKRPASTWTYMITDNQFGSPEERFLQFVGTIIRDNFIKVGTKG